MTNRLKICQILQNDHISIRVLHLISKLMSAIFEEQAEGDGETSGDVVSL